MPLMTGPVVKLFWCQVLVLEWFMLWLISVLECYAKPEDKLFKFIYQTLTYMEMTY
jgi:hypothetical protein